jgi:tRNA(Ile)-lysidine synthase
MNEQLLSAAGAALARAGLLRPDAVLLVALSGGPDSVALLRTMCALRDARGFAVRAAHVEHGLRGEASREDARFCERLCAVLSVPFTCDHAALTGGMAGPGAEERAREARYALLVRRAKACGADALLTAHHLDDQAETVLGHLARGSGARGLSGMREASAADGVTVLRPFLRVSHQDILRALGDAPYREDESNALPCCQRNRLRADVLPLLRRENPRAAEHIAQSACLLAMDEDCLPAQADALLRKALLSAPPFFCLRRDALLAAPDAVAVRALRRFARLGMERLSARTGRALPAEETVSAADSLALLSLVKEPAGACLNLPFALKAQAGERCVHLLRMADDAPRAPVPPPTPVAGLDGYRSLRFGGFSFRFSVREPGASPPPDGLRSVAVSASLLPRLTLRTALPGDRIRPFGAAGGKELRRYLTDRKVDAPFRPYLPLVCLSGEVLWAAGAVASEGTRLDGRPAVNITVSGALPWLAR